MYRIGYRDRVQELTDVPQSDVGAPLPVVLANEHCVLLAYLVSEPDLNWDGTYVNEVLPDTDGAVAFVKFTRPSVHMFGPPNDEAFSGHPLARRGLQPYSAFEVHNSSWLKMRIKMNRVHHRHSDSLFTGLRHFIFTFHDSTFECLARAFTVAMFNGSLNKAITQMASMLADDG